MGAKQPLAKMQEDFSLLEQRWELCLAESLTGDRGTNGSRALLSEWARFDWRTGSDIRRRTMVRQTTHSMFQIRAWGHNSLANPEEDDLPLPTILVSAILEQLRIAETEHRNGR